MLEETAVSSAKIMERMEALIVLPNSCGTWQFLSASCSGDES